MTDWFAPSYWVGGNPFAAGDASMAANLMAGQANMAAVQQQSAAAAAPTGYNPVYNSPVAFGDYNYGTVGGYPSFGEASGGGGGTGTPSTAEQPFSPSGGGGGYSWDPVYGDGSGGGGGGNNLVFDGVSFVRGGGGGTYGMNDMGQQPNYGAPSQPQQPQQNFADMWGDSGGRYPNSGYTPQVPSTPSIQQQLDAWPQGNAIWDPVYGDGSGGYGGGNDLVFDGVSFVRGGGGGLPGDIGSSPMSGGMPNLGYNPGMANWFANPGMSAGSQPDTNPYTGMPWNQAYPPGAAGAPQVDQFPSYQWPPGGGGGGNDLVFDGVSFVRGGGGMATGIDPMTGETTYGGARDGAAWALMAQQQQPDSFSPTGNYEQFRGPNLQDAINPLYQQRQEWATHLSQSPEDRFALAARLHAEDQNDPNSRAAIFESMLNADQATGRDPFNQAYYPQDGQYQAAATRLRNDPALLAQVYAEMDRVLGGSNVGNYSTDWGSDNGPGQMVATNARKYFTPTWLSPGGEQFYRKDQTPSIAGQGIINDNLEWLRNAQNPWPYVNNYEQPYFSPGGG